MDDAFPTDELHPEATLQVHRVRSGRAVVPPSIVHSNTCTIPIEAAPGAICNHILAVRDFYLSIVALLKYYVHIVMTFI